MTRRKRNTPSDSKEFYSIGYSARLRDWMQSRTAKDCASFFLPYFRDGMTLLDCGCGPGSITLDFAKLTPSGRVIGIDREITQLQSASVFAMAGLRIENLSFMAANVYSLPIVSEAVDAVFAHALLMHLTDPLRAIKEMRRVLKPGGFIGLADLDFGARVFFPSNPTMQQFQSLYLRVLEFYGARPYYARQQRSLLLEAGFRRSVGYASCVSFGDKDSTIAIAKSWSDYASSVAFRNAVISNNWVDRDGLSDMQTEIARWGEGPDSYLSVICCNAVGWV